MFKTRLFIIAALLLLGIFSGCGGGDGVTPNLPSQGGPQDGGYSGDQPEPPIPTPWLPLYSSYICDMDWELDGDLMVSTADVGVILYTPYGLEKRRYPEIGCVTGMTNNDTGRGMSYNSSGSKCNTAGIDDDIYVSDGHQTTVFPAQWYSGDPNQTPDMCDLTITMAWGCASGTAPIGYSYHPISGRTYIKLNTGGVFIGDSECETDWDQEIGPVVDPGELFGRPIGDGILSFDQLAPFPPDIWYTGPPTEPSDPAGDWVIYQDDCLLQGLVASLGLPGYIRMAETIRTFKMNGTDPPT
jgi:hypothetical protein